MLEGEMWSFWRPLHSTNPPNRPQDPSYVCILHPFLQPALPLFFPAVPDFTSFFATRFAAVHRSGGGVYLPTGKLTQDRLSGQYRPSRHKLLPWGWDKMPDCVITDYTLTHPTIPLAHNLEIWGLLVGDARELSGDIFYAKDVPRQAAIPATQPPLLKLPGCSPNSVRAKNLCISPRFTKHSGCFALQMETVSWRQKWKKRGISPNFTTWSCPLDPLPPDPLNLLPFLD